MMTSGEPIICGCGLRAGQTCSRQPCLRAHVTQFPGASVPWPYMFPAHQYPPMPQPTVTPWPSHRPFGCICPSGANKDCESPACPRKPQPHYNVTSSGGSANG
jgi:hypothetical protein